MPVPPATLKKIQAIRKFIASGGASGSSDPGLHLLIHKLFQYPAKIVSDAESLDAVLALAAEFETYRFELLWKLEENPRGRPFLVTVLQTQIDLGLNDEFGALFAVGEWDDAKEE